MVQRLDAKRQKPKTNKNGGGQFWLSHLANGKVRDVNQKNI